MLLCKEANLNEKSQIFAAVHTIWPHHADPDEHLKRRLASPQHLRASWYLGLASGEWVTSLGTYPYTLYGPDGHRSARVIAAVFTRPEARGHGYAQQLLRWVIAHYRKRGIGDFMLFSDIGTAYYEALGFQALPSYEWEFPLDAGELPAAASPGAADGRMPMPMPLELTQVGKLACPFGFERSLSDDRWIREKQPGELHLASWGQGSWLLSRREGERYLLLESNLSQEANDWDLFRQIVTLDAKRLSCRYAQGWWTAGQVEPGPNQYEILPRDKEILMWHSERGSIDAWYHEIARSGFRVFASEHV
jgi:GNAT superfamily N-acetyltransferase